MPVRLPGSTERNVSIPVSRLIHFWESAELSLNAVTGEVATYTRPNVSSSPDSLGVSGTKANDQPRWHWFDVDGDGTNETPTLEMGGTSELIRWDYLARPTVPLTGLIEFVESGAIAVVNAGVVYIGNDGATGARLVVRSNGSQYQVVHNNGVSGVTSTMAGTAPVVGQRVRLRFELFASGSVRIHQSIGSAAETSAVASGTLTPAAAWGDTRLRLGSIGTGNLGVNRFVSCRIAHGSGVARDTLVGIR